MTRPSRRVTHLPLPASRWEDGTDNGADGIDWDTGADFQDPDGELEAHIADTTDAHDASAVSYDPTTSGLTATDVQAAIDEVVAGGVGGTSVFYNVADYGAVGDGSTDDTSAITAAFTAADATDGGVIYFPPTTTYYKITSLITLTATSKYHLLGGASRYGSARVHQATSNTGAFKFAPGSDTANRTKAPRIENLVISGAGGASSGRGIEVTNDLHMEGCFVYGFYDGVYVATASYYSYIAHSTFTDCDHSGVRAVNSNNFTIDTCRFTGLFPGGSAPIGTLAYGIYIESASPAGYAMRIVNSSIEYFTQDGIWVDGGGAIDIVGNWFESSQSSSGHAYIRLGPGSNTVRGALISGNHLEGPGVSGFEGIKTDRATHVTIEANEDTTPLGALTVIISSTGNGSRFLLLNNAWQTGTITLPSDSYTLDPGDPPIGTGDAAGGDLSGTYPDPTVVNDSHNHSEDTVTGVSGVEVTGTPSAGQVLTATDADSATWATPATSSGGQILISDTPAGSPLVFSDLIQNEAGTDLVYADA